ncbi:ubiquinol-cytochrome C chaperone-domain-containing protein [Auriculariales sp. MPI-PUGE-AT-0066]|nr:ubiquinol-cytochrome C chaperone-domain-containing protein [Auriculariales sp. MPI-PUGE-AT-0066]
MLSRRFVVASATHAPRLRALQRPPRRLKSSQKEKTTEPVPYGAPERPPENRPSLAPWLDRHPTWKARFLRFSSWYYSSVVRARAGEFGPQILYHTVSDVHLQPGTRAFFYAPHAGGCGLPETFQTWFTIINLHAWLLEVRFRALPQPDGKYYIMALQSAFFKDVDLRMRDALAVRHPNKQDKMVAAPERMIKKYMSIYREQWHGMHLALDMALANPDPAQADAELAACIWRNVLDGRGARGIAGLPELPEDELPAPDASEKPDPGIGPPAEERDLDRYLEYPRLIWCLARYVRQNIIRLQDLSDEDVMAGHVPKFGDIDLSIGDLVSQTQTLTEPQLPNELPLKRAKMEV